MKEVTRRYALKEFLKVGAGVGALSAIAAGLSGCSPEDPFEAAYFRGIFPSESDTYNNGSETYRWLEGHFKQLYLNGKKIYAPVRTIGLVVAASDASDIEKSQADYVCDGVADEVEINNAIQQSKSVSLSSGTFNLSSPVTLNVRPDADRYGIYLVGRGYTTVLRLSDAANCNAIQYDATWPFWNYFGHFRIDGNKKNNSSGYGIEFEGWANIFEHIRIENTKSGGIHSKDTGTSEGNRYRSISISSCDGAGYECDSGVTGEIFEEIQMSACSYGLKLRDSFHRLLTVGTWSITNNALYLINSSNNQISNTILSSTSNSAIVLEDNCSDNIFNNVTIDNSQTSYPAIYFNVGSGKYCRRNNFVGLNIVKGSYAFDSTTTGTLENNLIASCIMRDQSTREYGNNFLARIRAQKIGINKMSTIARESIVGRMLTEFGTFGSFAEHWHSIDAYTATVTGSGSVSLNGLHKLEIRTGTTSGSTARIVSNGRSISVYTNPVQFRFMIAHFAASNTNQTIRLGFWTTSNPTSDNDTGFGIKIEDGNIYALAANGTANTKVNIGTLGDQYLTSAFEIQHRMEDPNSIRFYYNGSFGASISTNMPNSYYYMVAKAENSENLEKGFKFVLWERVGNLY